jgi:hypothetical protein
VCFKHLRGASSPGNDVNRIVIIGMLLGYIFRNQTRHTGDLVSPIERFFRKVADVFVRFTLKYFPHIVSGATCCQNPLSWVVLFFKIYRNQITEQKTGRVVYVNHWSL